MLGTVLALVLDVVLLVNIGIIVPLAALVPSVGYRLTARSLIAFTAAGLVGTVLGRAALYMGIQRVGASQAEPLKAANPLFAALVAVIVLGEVMVAEHVLGVVLIAVGVAILSWERASDQTSDQLGTVTDLAFPLLAALFFGIEPIFAKIGLNEGTPFLVGLAIKTLAATVGFIGYLWWRDALPTVEGLSTGGVSWYVAAGLANTGFLLALYASLSVAPVVLVAPIVQSSPLFVVALSFVFLQDIERVNRRLVAGVTVVVCGGVLVAIYG